MTTAVPTPRRMSVGATRRELLTRFDDFRGRPVEEDERAGRRRLVWMGVSTADGGGVGEEDGVGRHLDDAEGERDDDEVSSLSDDLRRAVVLLGARHGYGHRPDAPAQDVEGLLARRGRAGRGRGSDRRERRRQREHDAKYEFLPHLLSLRSPQMRRR